jgi:hypothetical protein
MLFEFPNDHPPKKLSLQQYVHTLLCNRQWNIPNFTPGIFPISAGWKQKKFGGNDDIFYEIIQASNGAKPKKRMGYPT